MTSATTSQPDNPSRATLIHQTESSGNTRVRQDNSTPIVIILGPTGSGKTALGIKLAQKLGGEIVSADSRAIYKGMDIGTAKPTREEQCQAPHHGLDLVDPGEHFTVADWKSYAESTITDIKARGKTPIIVGGTGLYIDALIYDYHFHGPTGHKINDIEQKTCSDRTEVKGNYLLIGVKLSRDELRIRLRHRLDQMFCPELYKEVKKLVQSYNWSTPAMTSNIYKFAEAYLDGKLTLSEAKEKCFYADYHLAKRQLTWFKRNPDIIWLPPEQIISFVTCHISPTV